MQSWLLYEMDFDDLLLWCVILYPILVMGEFWSYFYMYYPIDLTSHIVVSMLSLVLKNNAPLNLTHLYKLMVTNEKVVIVHGNQSCLVI